MTMLRRTGIWLLFLFIAQTAAAQTTTGSISGLVTDVQNSALSGVAVRARSAGTGFTQLVRSDQEGVYRLRGLPVGAYEITAELAGFQPFTSASVTLNVARDVSFDITMHVTGGAVDEALQEERRINFVALTRAERYCLVALPDTDFGEGGWALAGSTAANLYSADMLLLPNQTLLLVGSWSEGEVSEAGAARFDLSGALDPEFGDAGIYHQAIGSAGQDTLFAADLQDDGKVVAAGWSRNADLDAVVLRFGW